MQFERPHHQLIAKALKSLDAARLRELGVYFAGGTALALLHGEYRESNDMDFMVSDTAGYRGLRNALTGAEGFGYLAKSAGAIRQIGEIRADQYGIRGKIEVGGTPIKLEIVLEGRISFDVPDAKDKICGVTVLGDLDLAAEKMLANSDRWLEPAVFSRDIIDLAMMRASRKLLSAAVEKAELAYGAAVKRDIERAIDRVLNQPGWLGRCMEAMAISEPKAAVLQRIVKLGRDVIGPGSLLVGRRQ